MTKLNSESEAESDRLDNRLTATLAELAQRIKERDEFDQEDRRLRFALFEIQMVAEKENPSTEINNRIAQMACGARLGTGKRI